MKIKPFTNPRNLLTQSLAVICITVLLLAAMPATPAYAAVGPRGTPTTGSTTNTTLVIPKPAGVMYGDILLANISQVGEGNTNPIAAGWTALTGGSFGTGPTPRRADVLWRLVDDTEGASFTFTLGAGVTGAAGSIVAFSGVNTAGPIDVSGSYATTQNVTVTANSITTLTANDVVIMFGAAGSGTTTWSNSAWSTATSPGTLTELYDNQGGSNSVGAAYATKATAGATGNGSATLSSSQRNAGILVALKPETRTATTTTLSALSAITYGATATFTATVSPTPTTGTAVRFYNGAAFLGSGTTDVSGVASYTTTLGQTLTAVGSPHSITAHFVGDATRAPSTSSAGSQVVNKKALTITGSTAAAKVYDGTVAEPLGGAPALLAAEAYGAGNTSDGKPYTADGTMTLGGTAAGTFASKDVGPGKAVTVTGVTISGGGSGNYTLTQQTGLTADITPAALTITASNRIKTYGDDVTFLGTEFTTLPVTLFDSDSVTSVTLTSAGAAASAPVSGSPYTITPSLAVGTGLTNYTITYSDGELTVDKADQTITVVTHAPASAVYNTNFTVAATASSSLPVTYSATGGCTNLLGVFTMTSGTTACSVRFDQAGDGNYNAATQVVEPVTAEKATPTLSVTNSPVTYSGSPQAALVTGSVSGTPSNVKYDNSSTVPTNAGTYAVTANFVPTATADYETLTGAAAGNFVIDKASQTITVVTPSPSSAVYNTNFTVAATASSGLLVEYSAAGGCTNLLGVFTMTSGTTACTVRYDQAGDGNYNAATQVTETVTAEKATPTLAVTNSPVTYNGSPQAAAVSSGLVLGSVTDVKYDSSSTVPTNAGTYAVTAAFAPIDTTNYKSLIDAPAGNFVIDKASQTITVVTHAPSSAVYNTNFTVAATATSGLTVTYTSAGGCTNALGVFTMTSGTTACSVRFDQAGNSNYNAATQVVEPVTAEKATPTLAVTNSPVTYNGSPQAALVTGSVLGVVSNVKYDSSSTIPTNAGTYAVTANFVPTNTADYATLTGASAGDFVIDKASQTITVVTHAPSSAVYNTNFTVAATATSGLTVTYTSAGGCTNALGVFTMTSGTTACSVRFDQAGDGNYNAATQVVEPVTAEKATPTLSVTNSPVPYNGLSHTAVVEGSVAGTPSNVLMAGAASQTNAGTYAVTANFAPTDSANYATLTDAPAGNFVIDKASQTITVVTHAPANAVFGANFTVAATASSGLTVEYSAAGGCTNLLGVFTMTSSTTTCTVQYNQAGNGNYNAATQVTETVAAGKATPTLSVTNSPVTYSGSPQTATVSSGSVLGTVSNVKYNSSSTVPTNAGTYAVTADFTPTDTTNYNSLTGASAGDFVINKASQTITVVTHAPANAAFGAEFTVAATASSGLPVAYSAVGGCTHVGAVFTMTSSTTACTVQYDQAGDDNYNAATQVTDTVAAGKATPTLSVTNSPVAYDALPHSATVEASVAGVVSNVLTGGAATQTAKGTYTVTADFAPTDTTNYNSLTAAPAGNFVIEDNAPPDKLFLDGSETGVSVPEFQPAGALIGVLTGHDPDSLDTVSGFQLVSYSGGLHPACNGKDGDNGIFQITGTSGDELHLVNGPEDYYLDYETKPVLSICVEAQDNHGLKFDQAFTITVLNRTGVLTRSISVAAYDGFVTELGKVNAGGATLNVGDDINGKKSCGILSFKTDVLPDDAKITSATLNITLASVVGNPFASGLGTNLTIELKQPYFGTKLALEAADYTSPGVAAGTMTPPSDPLNKVYTADITPSAFAADTGTKPTQLRLCFPGTEPTADHIADYLKFYSGNIATGTKRPVLKIEYSLPTTEATLKSSPVLDGNITESLLLNGFGGAINSSATSLTVGDNAKNQEVRSILSFNTAVLPDNAVITGVQLRLLRSGESTDSPFVKLGSLFVDLSQPFFGTGPALKAGDFQDLADQEKVGTMTEPVSAANGTWYTVDLDPLAFSADTHKELTQLRLYFAADNADAIANFIKFYSGNSLAANRPQLVITFQVP